MYVCSRSEKFKLRKQKRTTGLKFESQARKVEAQLIRECERELIILEGQGLTWFQLLDKYEAYLRNDSSSRISQLTLFDYIGSLIKYTQTWYPKQASSINSVDVTNLFNSLSLDYSVRHRLKIKMLLNRIFTFGIENGHLDQMAVLPTSHIKLRKKDEKLQEVLTVDEIKKLLSAAKNLNSKWYPIWAMALLTGMRNSELYALTWDDIDFQGQVINVSKSYNKRTRETKSTKSGEWRKVPISSELNHLLLELKQSSSDSQFVLPRIRAWSMGYQAQELRNFCSSIGVRVSDFMRCVPVLRHNCCVKGFRRCKFKKIADGKILKRCKGTFAWLEIIGATECLKFIPEPEIMGKVVKLFS